MKAAPSVVISARAFGRPGPIIGRVLGIDPKRGLCNVSFGTDGIHIVPAKLILSANLDAWNAGLTWAPKYWRSGIGDNLPDWGSVPPERRAHEAKEEAADVPETLSLADFPATPGPERGGKNNE